jgi:hypothetical protein
MWFLWSCFVRRAIDVSAMTTPSDEIYDELSFGPFQQTGPKSCDDVWKTMRGDPRGVHDRI